MKKSKRSLVLIITVLFITACGKKATENVASDSQQEVMTEGTYWARLGPINTKVTKNIQGEVKVQVYGDEFRVKSNLKNAGPEVHKQYLHSGDICPEINADVNHDGYIDGEESKKTTGEILVPFDGDLSAISLGGDSFPVGNFNYEQTTSFSLMISDVEFNRGRFALERRVVTVWGQSPVGEIPLACGILTRVSDEADMSGNPANTWSASPAGTGGGKPPGGGKPSITKPTKPSSPTGGGNTPVRPPISNEPPQEDGGFLDDIIGTVRRYTEPVTRFLERFLKPNRSSEQSKPESSKPERPSISNGNNQERERQNENRNGNSGFSLRLPFKLPFGLGSGNNN